MDYCSEAWSTARKNTEVEQMSVQMLCCEDFRYWLLKYLNGDYLAYKAFEQ